MLCSLTYGANEYKVIMDKVRGQSIEHVVIASPVIYGSYHPVLHYYGSGVTVFDEAALAKEAHGGGIPLKPGTGAFLIGASADDQKRFPPVQIIVRRLSFEFYLLGYKIVPDMASEHFFQVRRITVARAGGFLQTGVVETGLKDVLVLGYVPRGVRIPVRAGRIDFRTPAPDPGLP